MSEKRVLWRHVKYHWEIYLFVLPTLISIGLFIYYPAATGIYRSFFRWNGSDVVEPMGWGNYVDLTGSIEFWRSFKNAFLLGLWNIVKMVPPLIVAVCIHRCQSDRLRYLYRILFVIPMVIPPLVGALIWRSFFFEATSGYLNRMIESMNLAPLLHRLSPIFGWGDVFAEGSSVAWLGEPTLIMTACVIWGFPWVGSLAVLTHLAKLQNIGREVYEAAEIDGVTWWTKFTRIELPLITESIYIMLVFTIIGTITDAGIIFALAGWEGGPGGKVDVPALFMIRKAFIDQKMGYACAVGIVLSLIVLTLQKLSTLLTNWSQLRLLTRRILRSAAFVLGLLMFSQRFLPVIGFLIMIGLVPYRFLAEQALRLLKKLGLWNEAFFAARQRSPQAITEANWRRLEHPSYFLKLRLKNLAGTLGKHAAIWSVLAFAFLPLYLMIIVSFKTNTQFYQSPTTLTSPMHFNNWVEAWELLKPTIANSVFLSSGSTILMIFLALSSAYFFARLRMPMSGFLWNAILILMMLPMIANLVPLFRLLRDIGLLNTLTALILVGAAQGQITAIFMLRSFVKDVPNDLFEAAEIDGANHFQQLFRIVLPLSGPILGTVGVMHFMQQWNEFLLPLVVMRDHGRLPVMVQLIRMAGEYIKLWGPLMAGYALAALPIIILFIFSMKLFVRGMTEGATKG